VDGHARRRWLLAAIRRDWAWLGAALAVAAVTILGFVIFGVYEGGYRNAATRALEAQLAASEINALEWQSIATGEVPAGAGSRLPQWLAQVHDAITGARLGPQTAAARAALDSYLPAVREEFSLIREGRIREARRVDTVRVDPAYERLQPALSAASAQNAAAASNARRVAVIGELAVIAAALAVAAALVIRFAGAQRALALAEAEQQALRETSRAKSDLVTVVSHNLRTPLTSIMGYLELLQDQEAGPVTEEQQEFLLIMRRNTSRLLAIANDLLFISRAEQHEIRLTPQEISLGRAASEAAEAQQLQARERAIDLQVTATAAPPIRADRERLGELIENLLSNAIKFTPPGGTVRVRTGPAGNRVRLEVSDTGAGISPSDQEHLFERFFRSPHMTGTPGAGLGLAIVKAIADAHGAAVTVSSTLGEGSAFLVDFPPAPNPPGITPVSSG